MRTSLNEIKLIADYLDGNLNPDDRLVFEARLLLEPELSLNVSLQKQIYLGLEEYHHQRIKAALSNWHDEIMANPGKINLRNRILNLFK